jgi:hypothetical protein
MGQSKVRKTFDKVRILSLASPCVRKQLIQKGGKAVIDCISECCCNILRGNVSLNEKVKSSLSKHKNKLRLIANKKISIRKKKLIIQTGKFPLTALLIPVVTALAGMLSG